MGKNVMIIDKDFECLMNDVLLDLCILNSDKCIMDKDAADALYVRIGNRFRKFARENDIELECFSKNDISI